MLKLDKFKYLIPEFENKPYNACPWGFEGLKENISMEVRFLVSENISIILYELTVLKLSKFK